MYPDSIAHRTEIGAFFVAFLGLFALATIPLVNLAVAPFVPIPLAAIFHRQGYRVGFLCLIGTMLLIMATAAAPVQLYSLPFLCSAFVLGSLARRQRSAVRTVVTGALALTFLSSSLFYGYNLYATTTQKMPTTEAMIDALYNPDRIMDSLSKAPDSASGHLMDEVFFWMTGDHLSGAAVKAQTSQEYTDFLKRNEDARVFLQKVNRFPIPLFFLSAIAYFALFYFAARWALARWSVALPDFDGFRTWRLPWTFAWAPIACFALRAACRLSGNDSGEFAFDGLLLATLVPYMAVAFSIVAYWVEKLRLDPLLAAVFYSFLILNLDKFAIVTIFDSWLDFRKLEKKEEPPADFSSHDGWDDDIDF